MQLSSSYINQCQISLGPMKRISPGVIPVKAIEESRSEVWQKSSPFVASETRLESEAFVMPSVAVAQRSVLVTDITSHHHQQQQQGEQGSRAPSRWFFPKLPTLTTEP